MPRSTAELDLVSVQSCRRLAAEHGSRHITSASLAGTEPELAVGSAWQVAESSVTIPHVKHVIDACTTNQVGFLTAQHSGINQHTTGCSCTGYPLSVMQAAA